MITVTGKCQVDSSFKNNINLKINRIRSQPLTLDIILFYNMAGNNFNIIVYIESSEDVQ